jgi:hypothetical protein
MLTALSIMTVGLTLQFRTYLNHDIAWILYSARWMMGGAVFGQDIVAVNPPLIWYLSMPILALADTTGWQPATVFRFAVAAVTLVIVYIFLREEPDEDSATTAPTAVALTVAAFAFFIDCRRDFGQREYLSLVLCLPYVKLLADRVREVTCSERRTLVAGVLAGIGVALKPHFLAVPVCLEIATGWMIARRSAWSLRPETTALAGTIVTYVCFLVLFVPSYTFDLLPLLHQAYWGFDSPLLKVIARCQNELIVLAGLLWILMWRRRSDPQAPLLIATAIGFLIACLAQKKGYSYHVFPIRACLFLAATRIALDSLEEATEDSWAGKLTVPSATKARIVLAFLIALGLFHTGRWYLRNQILVGDRIPTAQQLAARPQVQTRLINFLNQLPGKSSFLAISTHPYPAFPTALYVKPRWASRSNSCLFLPAIAKLRAAEIPAEDPRRVAVETWERNRMLQDLREQPAVVLLDARNKKHAMAGLSFDTLAFYQEDPRFRAEWSKYRETQPIGSNRVFIRQRTR